MADTHEPIIRQEEFLAFLKGYSPERKAGGERDMLAGRWRILSNQPLPEFSSSYAKAYVARDEKTPDASLYALVFDDGVPLRQKNINALKTFRHPALVSLLGEGVAQIGPTASTRYVAVLEKPAGIPLTEMLSRKGNPIPESLLIQQFLRPLSEILSGFAKMGISHNRINPGNIYLSGSTIVLGDCISEPSGFSQDILFEPIERMLTMPRGKADFASSADCYAVAMLALHLALGFSPFAQSVKESLIRDILSNGAYHTLVMPWDVPTGLQDFFRGELGDSRRDRWDALTIESWLTGRRYNLVMPSSSRETSRGFEFGGEAHFNRKSLAHGLWSNWKQALPMLADNRIPRWLKIHAHKQDTADTITRLTQSSTPLTPQQEEEALARVIIVLDPSGPIRFRQISSAVEGLGAQLAYALIAERHEDVHTLMQIIDADLSGFWMEQQKASPEHAALAAKLQKARNHIRMKGPGFGVERGLYDLNPGLPCLSPLLEGHHVTTLAEMLTALDTLSTQKAATEDAGDRHIAAFIASRLNLDKELRVPEVQASPSLKANFTLVMLKLLAKAQHKAGDTPFKGLTHWLAIKLLPLLGGMHSRVRQRKLQADLRAAVTRGSIEELADMFISSASFDADRREFQKASADYAERKKRIATLQGTTGLSHQASVKGHSVAQSIAYSVCIATVYVTLKACFRL